MVGMVISEERTCDIVASPSYAPPVNFFSDVFLLLFCEGPEGDFFFIVFGGPDNQFFMILESGILFLRSLRTLRALRRVALRCVAWRRVLRPRCFA